jgi:hypothetical protein
LKNNSGNRVDYHLALIAALREAGMKAYPVLLSTRDNGKLLEDFPNLDNLNYLITRLELDGQTYYLDPTKRYYGFGTIPSSCFNGFSWVVNDTGFALQLDPQDVKEKMFVQVKTVSNDEKNYQLLVKKVYGKYRASQARTNWIKDTLKIKKDIVEEVKALGLDAKLVNYKVDNLYNPDTSLVTEYVIKLDFGNDKFFLSPSLFNYYAEAPFRSERRYNPIEFPYAVDVNYSLNLNLPEHYTLEEVPSSSVLKYDDNDFYKYMIQYDKESNSLMLNTRLNMQRAFFEQQEYKDLKAYFNSIIEAQQKSVVIKKTS